MTPSEENRHTEGVYTQPHPDIGGLNPGLNPNINPVEFDEWTLAIEGEKGTFLRQYIGVAKRLFDRAVMIKTISRDMEVSVGQAAQMLPSELWMKRIAFDFEVSESTVYNVKRVVDSIPVERLPFYNPSLAS